MNMSILCILPEIPLQFLSTNSKAYFIFTISNKMKQEKYLYVGIKEFEFMILTQICSLLTYVKEILVFRLCKWIYS